MRIVWVGMQDRHGLYLRTALRNRCGLRGRNHYPGTSGAVCGGSGYLHRPGQLYYGPGRHLDGSEWNLERRSGAMAAAAEPLFSKTPDCPSVDFAREYFQAIVEWIAAPENQSKIEAIGLEAWANGPNQYLITGTGSGSPLEELGAYARIEFTKMDSETGRIIADNAQFSVYEWNGGGYEKSDVAVNREGDKYISDDLFRTDENEGKFYLEETLAPATGTLTGYYGDFEGASKRHYEFIVEEDMQSAAINITNSGDSFTNKRVTGSIQVKKTDIVHLDGVTGVLYRKDELVKSATIQNGACEYTSLYLGSYYIQERQKGETLADGKKFTYAEGYLLDETIYQVTLPYEGETVPNVYRQVESDKEQVIKAKALIEKVESTAGQGNINYLEGAGFTIYRIDKLSKATFFVQNADGTYDEQSIRDAYLVENYDQDSPKYDFRGETSVIVTVYLRDTDLRENTAFYWEDAQKDIRDGKLISLLLFIS